MRALLIIPLLLTSAAASSAQNGVQNASSETAPTDVLILRKSWHNDFRLRGLEDSGFSASNRKLEAGAPTQQQKAATIRSASSPPLRGPGTSKSPIDAPTAKSKSWHAAEQYIYRLKIKNTGAKKITALEWEYIFTDPVTGEELDSHRFQSFARIKPDGSSTLEGASAAPPTKIVTVEGLEKDARHPFEERVVIRCIAYSDMTMWENSARGKGECQSLSQRARKK